MIYIKLNLWFYNKWCSIVCFVADWSGVRACERGAGAICCYGSLLRNATVCIFNAAAVVIVGCCCFSVCYLRFFFLFFVCSRFFFICFVRPMPIGTIHTRGWCRNTFLFLFYFLSFSFVQFLKSLSDILDYSMSFSLLSCVILFIWIWYYV